MTDREYLELAARAAGYDIDWNDWLDCGSHTKYRNRTTGQWWNAEQDDGDALRLAMHLGMRVSLREAHADGGEIRICDNSDDWMCATRRAIVRAASEIGKGMK